MIEIEFIKSPDLNLGKNFKIAGNRLAFGHSLEANLIINDDAICSAMFVVELHDFEIAVASFEKEREIFFVNSKKFSGKKKIVLNDIIQFGDTSFKLLAIEFTPDYDNKHKMSYNYKEILKNNIPYSDLLHELEKELILIQTLQNERT